MFSKIKKEVVQNRQYFILSTIISAYVFLPQILMYNSLSGFLAIVLSAILLIIIAKWSKVLFLLVSLLTLFTSTVLAHIGYHWGTSTFVSRVQAAMLSPVHETSEYLSTYIGLIDLVFFSYFILGIYLLYYFLKSSHHTYKILKITGLLLFGLILFMLTTVHHLEDIRPYRYITLIIDANKWKSIVDERNTFIKNMSIKKHTISEDKLPYDKIVVIMEESVNKHHMSIYDYNISTTPFLTKLLKQEGSYKFEDVISPTNQTRYSIPIDLTNASVGHFYDFITSPSIISDFKQYGYKTYWISNQFVVGAHDTYISSIAKEADYVKIENTVSGGEDPAPDMILLKEFDKIHMLPNTKEFYFFHLMGSHFAYSQRYPKENALFSKPKDLIEEYDNSIYYTDHILQELYNRFKDTNVLWIYLSDHAEVVSLKRHGHGFVPASKDEYEIPLIMYSSLPNENLTKLFTKNHSTVFNMESFNHLVKSVAGIENNVSNFSKSTEVITSEPSHIIDYSHMITWR